MLLSCYSREGVVAAGKTTPTTEKKWIQFVSSLSEKGYFQVELTGWMIMLLVLLGEKWKAISYLYHADTQQFYLLCSGRNERFSSIPRVASKCQGVFRSFSFQGGWRRFGIQVLQRYPLYTCFNEFAVRYKSMYNLFCIPFSSVLDSGYICELWIIASQEFIVGLYIAHPK